jgi:hypothetical protein
VDSFHFAVVTLTIAGYGDINPATTAGKALTTVYPLIGVGVLVAFLTVTARQWLKLALTTTRPDDSGSRTGAVADLGRRSTLGSVAIT